MTYDTMNYDSMPPTRTDDSDVSETANVIHQPFFVLTYKSVYAVLLPNYSFKKQHISYRTILKGD